MSNKVGRKSAAFVRHFSILIHILPNAAPDESSHQALSQFVAKLFRDISVTEGNRPAYAKNRIQFAIECKASDFLI
ncbi:hypothetical protein FC25_GL002019 [Ligilactobacillus ruminis DSM 20403 = NBRC 102161]|uniref:Uncharacterized protein n=1 Tax=Ligilactobacillus ruminis (strain ATCC 27782 / RF3) TaxID=1069534 RepID=G2SM12_LIGR2|nr:Hypothetical protein LRC_17620 [Ligilactobacillus ruminis ATCC 27782]KRM83104.1 hypothetical protein FC25_GL002019 [Ligilactobacillus ruminis DSM 20403 = NBRC 102161]